MKTDQKTKNIYDLHDAIDAKNVQEIEKILNSGFDLTIPTKRKTKNNYYKLVYDEKSERSFLDVILDIYVELPSYQSVIEVLLNKMPIDYQDKNGVSIIMKLTQYYQVDLIHNQLKKGDNPNLKDALGDTALMYLTYMDSFEKNTYALPLIYLLIDYGAKKELENNKGVNAFAYAAFYGLGYKALSKLSFENLSFDQVNQSLSKMKGTFNQEDRLIYESFVSKEEKKYLDKTIQTQLISQNKYKI